MTQSISAQIHGRVAQRSMLSHEFYVAWSQGSLPASALKLYAAQYFRHVEAFPRYLSAIHSNCDRLETRQKILENLIDEEQGPGNHPALRLSFAKSLGVDEAAVRAAEAWPETQALVDTFLSITKNGDYREGLAALLAYEGQIPAVARTKMDGLAAFYGITDPAAIRFFQVHLEADEVHSAAVGTILDDETPASLHPSVLAAADRARDALCAFLDAAFRSAFPDHALAATRGTHGAPRNSASA